MLPWPGRSTKRPPLRFAKINAETGQIHVDSGVITPEEERERIANDPDTRSIRVSIRTPDLKRKKV
jgi:hypothetical protein